ncbi:MAG: hypothetical protein ABI867_05685 [Kofleriaceae bacterium]
MASDDDILTAPIPEPDAEPTAAERAHAKAFAELIDKTFAGASLPPAMSADDRALVEMATVIRAATGGLELAASKQSSIVEAALRQAIGGNASKSLPGVTPIGSARSRKRFIPWVVAATATLVAVAAILMLWLRTPTQVERPVAARDVPTSWRSRSADSLIGEIKRPQAADASARIDTIFADRLAGYRDRRLTRGGGKP